MNALAHCVEAAYAIQRSPEAEAIALAGAWRLHDALPRVVDDPTDLDARTDLLAGAALAGRALQNATMGVHHGLSQLLGGRTGIPHGLANALVLPARDALQRAGRARGDGGHRPRARRRRTTRPPPSSALRARLGLEARLRDVGVTEDDLDAVARLSQGSRGRAAQPPAGQRGRRPGHPRRRLVGAGAVSSHRRAPAPRRAPRRRPGRPRPSMPSCS